MTTPNVTTTAGALSPVTNHTSRSSKKSIWWKRGEHLVQHTPTGTFYCRLKVNGKTATIASVRDFSWPIARPLFMYTNGEPAGVVKSYIAWILGPDGQQVVKDQGFVPLGK